MKQPGKFEIRWVDRGRPPKIAPNPAFPKGCKVDWTRKGPAKVPWPWPLDDDVPETAVASTCVIELPYPSGHKNVGTWLVRCQTCGLRIAITAASRPDDARSVRVLCKEQDRGDRR